MLKPCWLAQSQMHPPCIFLTACVSSTEHRNISNNPEHKKTYLCQIHCLSMKANTTSMLDTLFCIGIWTKQHKQPYNVKTQWVSSWDSWNNIYVIDSNVVKMTGTTIELKFTIEGTMSYSWRKQYWLSFCWRWKKFLSKCTDWMTWDKKVGKSEKCKSVVLNYICQHTVSIS